MKRRVKIVTNYETMVFECHSTMKHIWERIAAILSIDGYNDQVQSIHITITPINVKGEE